MSEPTLDLRPMGIGEILDRSFRLYRDNFVSFFGILLVVQGSLYVLTHLMLLVGSILGQGGENTTAALIAVIAAGGVVTIVTFILTPLSQGALTLAVSERFLGRTVSVGQAYKRIMPRFMSLLGAGILVTLLVGIGIFLLVVPGVYFIFAFLLTSVVVVLEGSRATAAMSRSRELMRVKTEKGFFSFKSNTAKASIIMLIVLGLQIVIAVMSGAVGYLVGLVMVHGQTAATGQLPWAAQAIDDGVTTLLQTVSGPFYTIAIILLYYDIRIRFEGFDLEMMAKSLGQARPAEGSVLANH